MKRILIAVMMVAVTAGYALAAESNICVLKKEPKATTPVGAVVECCGVIVGKLASAVEISATGVRQVTVENETGECKVLPFCAAAKVMDSSFNAMTFDQLKAGEKVKVEYVKEGGAEKAKTVTVEK